MKNKSLQDIKIEKSVVAIGKFQGLHKGHMLLIDKVIELSRIYSLPAALITIDIKQPSYINTFLEREEILENKGIDYNVVCEFNQKFASLSPREFVQNILVKKLNPRYVVVGEDFRFGHNREGDVALLSSLGDEFGFEVIAYKKLINDSSIISTSYIRELITEGRVNEVIPLLGRTYQISGRVVEGKKLGRKLGFPTVNIIPDEDKLLPRKGVYYTNVNINSIVHKAVTNVGINPTVDGCHGFFVETHIIDYSGDLYGKRITINFLEFIRPEKRFESVDELCKQIALDKEYVMYQ